MTSPGARELVLSLGSAAAWQLGKLEGVTGCDASAVIEMALGVLWRKVDGDAPLLAAIRLEVEREQRGMVSGGGVGDAGSASQANGA